MKVLVLGGSGSIGSAILAALLASGHEVIALARSETSAARVGRAGATPLAGDIRVPQPWSGVLAEVDAVVHAAATFEPDMGAVDRSLIDLSGTSKQKNDILIFSFDQQLGSTFGAFTRFGWRLDDEIINYRALYSGGIDIKGTAWNRILDNIGIGLVYLEGGNNRIEYTKTAEAYYRMVINPHFALTADIQYTRDEYIQIQGAEGYIVSLRATANF